MLKRRHADFQRRSVLCTFGILRCGLYVIALLPEPSITVHPFGGRLKRRSLQTTKTPPRVPPARDESGAFENPEMFDNRWHGNGERLCEILDRPFPHSETRQNGSPSRI